MEIRDLIISILFGVSILLSGLLAREKQQLSDLKEIHRQTVSDCAEAWLKAPLNKETKERIKR